MGSAQGVPSAQEVGEHAAGTFPLLKRGRPPGAGAGATRAADAPPASAAASRRPSRRATHPKELVPPCLQRSSDQRARAARAATTVHAAPAAKGAYRPRWRPHDHRAASFAERPAETDARPEHCAFRACARSCARARSCAPPARALRPHPSPRTSVPEDRCLRSQRSPAPARTQPRCSNSCLYAERSVVRPECSSERSTSATARASASVSQ